MKLLRKASPLLAPAARKIFFFALASLLALLLAEFFLRVSGAQAIPLCWQWDQGGKIAFSPDLKRIWRLRPNVNVPSEEHRTDEYGFRTDSRGEVSVRGGRMRIFVLGDSNIFGHGIGGDQTVPYLLQKRLRDAGYDVAVINAGVHGYSPSQEYIYLKDTILPLFKPPLVVWFISPNDGGDMEWYSLHILAGKRLIRIPAWIHGVFLQGLAQRAVPLRLQGSLLVNWAMAALGRFYPCRWLERPSGERTVKKLERMVENIERQGTEAVVVRLPDIESLHDPQMSGGAWLFTGFEVLFRRYLDANGAIRSRLMRGAGTGKGFEEAVERLVLTPAQDELRHLSPAGSEACARAVFDYLVDSGMADRFPRRRKGKS